MAGPPQPSTVSAADQEIEAARRHARVGEMAAAEQCYRRVLEILPYSIESLVFLGLAAQSRGDDRGAVNLLSRASKADPANVDILLHLGGAYRTVEQFDAARYVLERAVRLAAGANAYARLALAKVLELDHRPELALLHYCRALIEAQRLGRWSVEDDKVRGLGTLVAHARRFALEGRRAWFKEVLQASTHNLSTQNEISAHGAISASARRIDKALESYLDARPPLLPDPQQRVALMDVPGIATARFLDDPELAWAGRVPAMIVPCLREMRECVAAARSGQTSANAGFIRVAVFKAGVLQYEARRYAPTLLATLRELPLARVHHHAPDVDIIALDAHARSGCHYGRSNCRCRVIVNPAGSAAFQVIVGGESRVLQPAAVCVVDPSFGVDYAHAGGAPSLALTLEVWHPDLSESERRAVGGLIAAMVEFDQRLQELD